MVWYGMTWHGTVRYGTPWYSMVELGILALSNMVKIPTLSSSDRLRGLDRQYTLILPFISSTIL